jgi:hypothetical protein
MVLSFLLYSFGGPGSSTLCFPSSARVVQYCSCYLEGQACRKAEYSCIWPSPAYPFTSAEAGVEELIEPKGITKRGSTGEMRPVSAIRALLPLDIREANVMHPNPSHDCRILPRKFLQTSRQCAREAYLPARDILNLGHWYHIEACKGDASILCQDSLLPIRFGVFEEIRHFVDPLYQFFAHIIEARGWVVNFKRG